MYRRIFGIAALLALLISAPSAASAAKFYSNESGSVGISEFVDDDIYAAGNNVTVSNEVSGDVLAAAGNIFISGEIGESVFAVGGTLTLSGDIQDDVRAVGGNIFINGSVAHDAIIIGGQLNVAQTGTVLNDLVAVGGVVMLDGEVHGNALIRAGEVIVNGSVSGSADIKASKITFGPDAEIGGALIYAAATESPNAEKAAPGRVSFTQMAPNEAKDVGKAFLAFISGVLLLKVLSLLAVALVVGLVFKKRVTETVAGSFAVFGWDLLRGFGALILTPIASIILLVTILGAPLGLLLLCLYGLVLTTASIIVPIYVGALTWKLASKQKNYAVTVWSIIVGVLIFSLLALVPIAGALFAFVFFLVALGALTRKIISLVHGAR